MDKFDEVVKDSAEQPQPSAGFVDNTMQQINNKGPKRRFNFRLWVPALAVVIVIVIAAILILPNNKSGSKSKTSSYSQLASQASRGTSGSTLPSGTDNATLASDLNSINTSINRENADQSNANSALNDSSKEISIPTYQ